MVTVTKHGVVRAVGMSQQIPSQCPECRSLNVRITRVSPDDHDRSEEWATRVECDDCDAYTDWFR
ncbi:hypothetical protein QA600_11255 [Natronococcus sp. A-GB1]|uniref:hypothetical protein n=1 Tax=Natronococcus sp. A-GB1 TaxID=3037648 RepID=UPI00241DE08F|nr:hypothetical protein [Natronococcus sp. A-GB1]MDG5759917.1 hypothetical protein [Natronococcus sp. A-GB1]